MGAFAINRDPLRDILLRNWMTHDALWYGEVAAKFGMAEASPMNLRVCRELGRTEFKRLMKVVQAPPPKDFEAYRELFELGKEVFVREFITIQIDCSRDRSQFIAAVGKDKMGFVHFSC